MSVVEVLQEMLKDEVDAKVDLRKTVWLICGDHGARESQNGLCPVCEGYAQPLPNARLVAKFKKQA